MPTICLVEVTRLRTEAVDGRQRYFQKKQSESSSYADMRRSISTKFCMMIKVVRASFHPQTFLGPINSLAVRGRGKFG